MIAPDSGADATHAGGGRHELIDLHPAPGDMERAAVEGMGRSPKQLPSWFLYDEEGSRLFERICQQPEYTLMRIEIAVLERHAADMAAGLGHGTLVEFGPGSATGPRRHASRSPLDAPAPRETMDPVAFSGSIRPRFPKTERGDDMARAIRLLLPAALFFLAGFSSAAQAPEKPPLPTENFYNRSLHYTAKGIEYWYGKEQGGIGRITGMTAQEQGCVKAKCHVASCDACHLEEKDGKAAYSAAVAKSEEACARCHPVSPEDRKTDVHFSRGMKCMGCHSVREIHGDGTAYNSSADDGALDTRCENCHKSLTQSASHRVHGGKLDCAACHAGDYETCLNCHLETRAKGKSVSITLKGTEFLVNHRGKVTTGNFLSYTYGKKTMITLAPSFSHKVIREGRRCEECHATPIVQDIRKGTLRPFTYENGEVKNLKGVIPVVDGMKWDVPFFDYVGEKWVPLKDPEPPLVGYSRYCTPLSEDQLGKLEKAHPSHGT